jgi:hypothetical protein
MTCLKGEREANIRILPFPTRQRQTQALLSPAPVPPAPVPLASSPMSFRPPATWSELIDDADGAVIQSIRRLIEGEDGVTGDPVRVLILYGKPGRGKTSLATVAGRSPKVSHFTEINASLARRGDELRMAMTNFLIAGAALPTLQRSARSGGFWSEARRERERAAGSGASSSSSSSSSSAATPSSNSPPIALLFLDEADGLGSVGQGMVASFIAHLQEDRAALLRREGWSARVILACNDLGEMHEATLSRADLMVEMPRPSPSALVTAAVTWGYHRIFAHDQLSSLATRADGDYRAMRQLLELEAVMTIDQDLVPALLPAVQTRGLAAEMERERWAKARGLAVTGGDMEHGAAGGGAAAGGGGAAAVGGGGATASPISPLRVPPDVARVLGGGNAGEDGLAVLERCWRQGYERDMFVEWVETLLTMIDPTSMAHRRLLAFRADLRRRGAPHTLLQILGAYARHYRS